ncbi:SAM-dependent methyltransferase [Acidocella facilis]|uniref:SAM-dependent methyltransferase n=1 Tax=Acidocella facilis TaxID=525 RepID=UPI001F2D4EAF|nr:cyclopropane-fatty-acyl-phospholipid synthase family protein [Acidocella facilis]
MEYVLAINPALTFGEAYMNGTLVIEEGSLYDVLKLVAINYNLTGNHPWLSLIQRTGRYLKQHNPIAKARQNVAHHYDLSAELYATFLDRDWQYSCAYFQSPTDNLDTAQENKKRHIAAKLFLNRPDLKVLDIGSGWGGLGLYLAAEAAADVTGVTLSAEQHKHSEARAATNQMADRIRFHLRDYREERGRYDRVVSIGMFEHVGKRNYAEFFAKLGELLTEDGVALIHTIGYSDAPGPINPFIRKYIFPGADLPTLSEIFPVVERARFIATDVEVLRLHYAETLCHWRKRFMARRDEVVRLYDERFCRMWEFYLALCEIGFRYRGMVVFQLQLTKRLDAVPLTRDYILDWENEQTSKYQFPGQSTWR